MYNKKGFKLNITFLLYVKDQDNLIWLKQKTEF